MKWLTGGDAIRVRRLHENSWEYTPTFKIWLATNYGPVIRGTDVAIWSRIKLIPFDVSFEGREDRGLKNALQQEMSGLLTWAVRGCLEWQREGLGASSAVLSSTAEYRAECDGILQELRAEQHDFPTADLRAVGYGTVWHGERSWNGVAILAKGVAPVLTRIGLPGNAYDHQARYIEAAGGGILIASVYLPNGNPQPGPKFDYKLAWFERLISHAGALIAAKVPVVLAGDFNVVPTPQDIYPTKSLENNALIQPASRAAFARLLAQGWQDALRRLHPGGPLWTFWDYERGRWPADKGMRLDHILLSASLSERLIEGGVDRWVRGEPNASDHAPAWIRLE
jgi:exodeoxyribonuclease-3